MASNKTVESAADIAENAGAVVTVIGTYREVDIRRKQTPPPQFVGHVAIELSDGEQIMLEPSWSPDARRPEDERRRFAGKPVAVVGTLHETPPPAPDDAAALDMPCLSPVRAIDER
jgi:hypothetical protein